MHEKYKRLRNRAVASLRRDKKKNAAACLDKGMNPWKLADRILGKRKLNDIVLVENGGEVQSDKEKAEVFNRHFIDKVRGLRDKVNTNVAEDPLEKLKGRLGPRVPTFYFSEVHVKEVKTILKKMKKSKSAGVDEISSLLIRPVINEIAPALTSVINRALRDGIFPSLYKCARVTPIFKGKGSRTDKNNYRPVSNLSLFGKCQEVCVDVQLRIHCEKLGLFGTHQHGYR